MTHGFGSFACTFYKYLKPLSEKYRIVLFDNCGWGLNTRLDESWSTISSEDAEAWLSDWVGKVIESLELPDKFYIAAHAEGNYLMSLYASQHYERVEAFFMISPTHMEAYDKADYDPYSIRYSKDITKQFAPKEFVDLQLEWDEKPVEERDHPLVSKVSHSEYFLRKIMIDETSKLFEGIPDYKEEDILTYSEYLTVAYQRISVIDNA